MAVEVWMGEEYEFGHEAKAFMSFVENMVSAHADDRNLYLILANFIVDSCQIDLAVLKRNRIFVIELKEVGGAVSGGENGPWKVVSGGKTIHEVRGGSHGNPYLQVRDYRYSLANFLKRNQSRFCKNRSDPRVDWAKAIGAIVAFSPTLSPESQIDVPRIPWFQVTGLDELHLIIYRDRLHGFSLFDQEMRLLIEQVLHLTPVPLNKIIKPPSEIIKSIPSTTVVSPSRPTDISTDSSVTDACFVCGITGSRCKRSFLKGTLKDFRLDEAQKTIILSTGNDDEIAEIRANSDWIEKIGRVKENLNEDERVTVAFYHLDRDESGIYIPNQDSLMILEPDWLISVTDLAKIDYCHRELLLERYFPNSVGPEAIRGGTVHQLFPILWKKPDFYSLESDLEKALCSQAVNLAVLGCEPTEMKEEIEPHIRHLCDWAQRQSRNTALRSETFVLSPLLGMKGRIDAIWEQDGRPVILGELKTGAAQGPAPKPKDEFQVVAYALMLFAQGVVSFDGLKAALLMYSGNDNLGGDGRNIKRIVSITMEKIRKVVNYRNEIILIDYTGKARFEINPKKCKPCKWKEDCGSLALLMEQSDPRPAVVTNSTTAVARDFLPEERKFFQHYTYLLMNELRQVKKNHATLWAATNEEREKEGKALRISLDGVVEATVDKNGGWRYRLLAAGGRNNSEIRVGDTVLISGEPGPSVGRIVLGNVLETTAKAIVVHTPEQIQFKPSWIDLYTDENLTERLFAGLYKWMVDSSARQRRLVIGKNPPTFSDMDVPDIPLRQGDDELNEKQREAVKMAVQANDYLVVLGPPGSGKTALIEKIVRVHLELGRHILIVAGTNRAIDEALRRLASKGLADKVIRLGNESAVSPELAELTLGHFLRTDNDHLVPGSDVDFSARVQQAHNELVSRPIIGATVSTLLSGDYDSVLPRFDLVIVDEAAQLTLPATLGALRFGDRFVLIGDHHQLPAVVQSETRNHRYFESDEAEINQSPLSRSLFDILRKRLEVYKWEGLIKLTEQYRMNDTICTIPSEIWYESNLKPANKAVARGRLAIFRRGDESLHPLIDPDKPVIFFDVPINSSGGPRTNYYEARGVAEIMKAYLERGLNAGASGQDGQVGVISPFRAQVALIRRVLEEELGQRLPIETIRKCVDTVDRFQGSQRDLIILSLASYSGPLNDLLRDERRLNVAITRARHKLIILGNYQLLIHEPIFYTLLKTIEERVGYKDWRVSWPVQI